MEVLGLPILLVLIIGITVVDFLALAWEDPGWAGWAMAFTTGGVIYEIAFGNIVHYTNWLDLAFKLLIFGLVYWGLGTVWAVKKWITFVKDKKAYFKSVYPDSWQEKKPPTPGDNKRLIVAWMYLWPWSLTWWVLTWPREAAVWTYNKLAAYLTEVANRIWADG